MGDLRVKKRDRNYAGFSINQAYVYLVYLPVVFLIAALALWKKMNQPLYAQLALLGGLTFLSIWIFGRKRPKLAFAVSLALYALITIPVIYLMPRIILYSRFFILAPYIFLWIGIKSYDTWETLDEEIGDKNSG